MKSIFVAAALAVSMSSVLAAGPAEDPNVVAAQGSFTEGSGSVTVPINTNAPAVSPVPEADSLLMLAAGVGVVGALALSRRNKK